jgi:hypothetical protein
VEFVTVSDMPDPDSNHPRYDEGAEIVPDTPEKMAFVRGLISRGEAARPNPDGSLPKGVTHEIIRETPNGLPAVRRRRFY